MREVQARAVDTADDMPGVCREEERRTARPLRIVAHMRGPVTGAPMLDGLLAAVVAQQRGLVAGFGPLEHVDIPIEWEPGTRFHLASGPLVAYDGHEHRWVNRKFPLGEAQMLGDTKLKRVHLGAGPTKSYRIPHEAKFCMGDQIAWYCVGDEEAIRSLLVFVGYLGRRRAVGRGAVERWLVEPTEPWGGFPLVQDGKALRPLPVDWPGLVEPTMAMHTLTYPYWEHTREELCAVPG